MITDPLARHKKLATIARSPLRNSEVPEIQHSCPVTLLAYSILWLCIQSSKSARASALASMNIRVAKVFRLLPASPIPPGISVRR
ncbi:hypothetical protein BDN71DRAFT_1453583 [Pleurotus eryngii]|uniref:Uncharacterized protein n=1 Tax=Pleurotus eryngii TaxID=5323 RepID=A0A9P6DCR3_PLEER|nr:hypothetical protein BDN71DRAFT_1453583 [Pleurotus eryngii]